MNHQEQHHQHHLKERAEEKKHDHQLEQGQDKTVRTIHPLWFVVIGSVLLMAIVAIWIFSPSLFFAG